MRIAINTRFLLPSKMEGFGWYTYEVAKRLVESHPEHEFIFLFDRPYDEKFLFGSNVTPVVLSPQARHPLLFRIWFNWSVTRALKKHKADVFFSPDGYISLRTAVPQVAVIHDLNFEHYPQDVPRTPRRYLKNFFPLFAEKAAHIITVSEYSRRDIVQTYHIPEGKVTAAWNGASELFVPLEYPEKEQTRNKYAKGKPYFIFVGALHPRKNVPRLLQAFSQFCNLNDEIDLLIVGESLWKKEDYGKLSLSEKVRSRVHFTGHVPLAELTKLMGSAMALVYVPYFEGFGIPLAEAMKCGIPIVAGDRTSLPEVARDAALYCDPFSVEGIASTMFALIADPFLYREIASRSLARGKLFSWDHTAEACWKAIENAGGRENSETMPSNF
jgi:glycosyltransferase involved in cell wall biosynthesis